MFGFVAERADFVLNDRLPLKCNGLAAKHKRLFHCFLCHSMGVCKGLETPLLRGATWEWGGEGKGRSGVRKGREGRSDER